jgi:hypothetical protein
VAVAVLRAVVKANHQSVVTITLLTLLRVRALVVLLVEAGLLEIIVAPITKLVMRVLVLEVVLAAQLALALQLPDRQVQVDLLLLRSFINYESTYFT